MAHALPHLLPFLSLSIHQDTERSVRHLSQLCDVKKAPQQQAISVQEVVQIVLRVSIASCALCLSCMLLSPNPDLPVCTFHLNVIKAILAFWINLNILVRTQPTQLARGAIIAAISFSVLAGFSPCSSPLFHRCAADCVHKVHVQLDRRAIYCIPDVRIALIRPLSPAQTFSLIQGYVLLLTFVICHAGWLQDQNLREIWSLGLSIGLQQC